MNVSRLEINPHLVNLNLGEAFYQDRARSGPI
jgi:hypothetical protein